MASTKHPSRVVPRGEALAAGAACRVGRRALLAQMGIAGAALAGMSSSAAATGPQNRPGWLNVTEHGVRGDGQQSETPALASILKRIGAEAATLYLPRGRYTINDDLTIPPNVVLVMDNGAMVEPAEGVTVAIAGPLLAGPYEVFGGAGRVVGRLGAAVALPQWWGARADGKHDDATAINRAIQAMSDAGGGTVHLPPGTYLLGTVTRSRVPKEPRFATLITPKSGVNIEGEGDVTVLRAADGLSQDRQWNFIYPPDAGRGDPLTDVTYRQFKVDGNGESNLHMARARWNAIGTNFGARITIDSLTFVNNAGRQCLRFGNNAMPHTVRDLTIRNCRFDTVGGAIQGNDGQTDHSSIYAQADGCLIQDNVFTQPALDRTNASTAIEVHASNAIVSGNYIRNYRGGINVVAAVTDQINVIYTDNVIVGCEGSGFKFWCSEHVMDRVRITRNTVEQHGPLPGHPKREQAAVAPMIGMGVRTPIRSIVIEGNNLSYVGEREAPDDLNIGYGISIGRCHDLRIIGNRITGTLRSALAHDGTITPLTDDLQRIEILDNQITDCCRATNARDTARTAILLAHNPRQRARTLRFLRVERNSIVNSGDEPTMQRGVYCTLGLADGAITSNVVIGASTDLAWDDASRIHRLHVEHAGVGSPDGVVRASAGSRYTNRDTGDAWDKVEGNTSANGWALRAHGVKAPTAGSHKLGDIVYNRAPKPGAPTGWVCVKAGEPGSFAAFGHIES